MSEEPRPAGFDPEAYFDRIGYTGPRTPTLDTLRAIVTHHTRAIPFENLDPLMRRPARLDIGSLQEKIVHGGRGGYCFEQNLLLSHALRAIGFAPIGLAGRTHGHMLLRIDLDDAQVGSEANGDASGSEHAEGGGAFVVDAGFGGLTLTGVLRLVPDVEQATPHEPFRLIRVNAVGESDEFRMQAKVRRAWVSLYRFTLQRRWLGDYEIYNWYWSTNPKSHFVTTLIAARADPDRRYVLRNADFAIHHLDGATERRTLSGVDELHDVLAGTFRVRLPDDTDDLDAALTRIATTVVSA